MYFSFFKNATASEEHITELLLPTHKLKSILRFIGFTSVLLKEGLYQKTYAKNKRGSWATVAETSMFTVRRILMRPSKLQTTNIVHRSYFDKRKELQLKIAATVSLFE